MRAADNIHQQVIAPIIINLNDADDDEVEDDIQAEEEQEEEEEQQRIEEERRIYEEAGMRRSHRKRKSTEKGCARKIARRKPQEQQVEVEAEEDDEESAVKCSVCFERHDESEWVGCDRCTRWYQSSCLDRVTRKNALWSVRMNKTWKCVKCAEMSRFVSEQKLRCCVC